MTNTSKEDIKTVETPDKDVPRTITLTVIDLESRRTGQLYQFPVYAKKYLDADMAAITEDSPPETQVKYIQYQTISLEDNFLAYPKEAKAECPNISSSFSISAINPEDYIIYERRVVFNLTEPGFQALRNSVVNADGDE